MNKIILIVSLTLMLTGCALMEQIDTAAEAVDDYYGNDDVSNEEIDLYDDEIPAGIFNEASYEPGFAQTVGSVSYNLLNINRTEDMLYLEIEMTNNGIRTIDAISPANFRLYKGQDVSDSDATNYIEAMMTGVERKLSGRLVPGGRIAGQVAFSLTDVSTDTLQLKSLDTTDHYEPLYNINSSNIGSEYTSAFNNDSLPKGVSLGEVLVSEVLSITINSVIYETEQDTQKKVAQCSITVYNHSDTDRIFLPGYNIICAYDLKGTVLKIRSESMTIPKVITAESTVSGTLTIEMSDSDAVGLYLWIRPSEESMDETAYVILN